MFFFSKTHTLKPSTKALLLLVFGLFVVFNVSHVDFSRYQGITRIQEDYNLQDETGRLNIWKIGIRTMLTNPLTGVGVSSFGEAVGRDRGSRGLAIARWQAPHNMFIQVAAETGVIGLFLYVLMSLNVFKIFGRVIKSGSPDIVRISEMGRIGFVGLLVSGFFLSQAYSIYWPFYLAVSSVVSRLYASELKSTHGQPNPLRQSSIKTRSWAR
jgi:O-antigen ligase